jgi:hypothetical protein
MISIRSPIGDYGVQVRILRSANGKSLIPGTHFGIYVGWLMVGLSAVATRRPKAHTQAVAIQKGTYIGTEALGRVAHPMRRMVFEVLV